MTAGATEALSGALLALLDTGDEVVLFTGVARDLEYRRDVLGRACGRRASR